MGSEFIWYATLAMGPPLVMLMITTVDIPDKKLTYGLMLYLAYKTMTIAGDPLMLFILIGASFYWQNKVLVIGLVLSDVFEEIFTLFAHKVLMLCAQPSVIFAFVVAAIFWKSDMFYFLQDQVSGIKHLEQKFVMLLAISYLWKSCTPMFGLLFAILFNHAFNKLTTNNVVKPEQKPLNNNTHDYPYTTHEAIHARKQPADVNLPNPPIKINLYIAYISGWLFQINTGLLLFKKQLQLETIPFFTNMNFTCLCFLHLFWTLIFLNAFHAHNRMRMFYTVYSHLFASYLTLLTILSYENNLIWSLYVILFCAQLFAIQQCGVSFWTIRKSLNLDTEMCACVIIICTSFTYVYSS